MKTLGEPQMASNGTCFVINKYTCISRIFSAPIGEKVQAIYYN